MIKGKNLIPLLTAASLASVSRPPMQSPPNNIPVERTPMFISLGWDDNSHSGMPGSTAETGGIKWVCDFTKDLVNPAGTGQAATFDGSPVRTTFFSNSFYIEPFNGDFSSLVKWVHNYAYQLGHEIANHTHSHLTGGNGPTLSVEGWKAEIYKCSEMFSRPAPESASLFDDPSWGAGIPMNEIIGFRSPYLFYGNNLFKALKELNFRYDSSIEEGMDPSQDGTNFYWPYTMDHESPGHRYMSTVSGTKEPGYALPEHPGIWQLPVYALIAPPDEECENYGLEPGFRQRLSDHFTTLGKPGAFNVNSGKISGLDYNMFYFLEFNLTKDEALATLKYSLDQRMRGNRAPMIVGLHSQYYTPIWNTNAGNIPSEKDRQALIEEFVQYALETYEDVRIVPMRDLMTWLEDPVPLGGDNTSIASDAKIEKEFYVKVGENSLTLPLTKSSQVNLYTVSGREIISKNVTPIDGYGRVSLPAGLVPGRYILHAENISASIIVK